jgi:cyclic beta-1,2-glucan synthetase
LDEIGSEGHGESVWLGFLPVHYILKNMAGHLIEKKDGAKRKEYYLQAFEGTLEAAIEGTPGADDRYLRAIHDNGTEIGIKGKRRVGN